MRLLHRLPFTTAACECVVVDDANHRSVRINLVCMAQVVGVSRLLLKTRQEKHGILHSGFDRFGGWVVFQSICLGIILPEAGISIYSIRCKCEQSSDAHEHNYDVELLSTRVQRVRNDTRYQLECKGRASYMTVRYAERPTAKS